MLQAQDEQIRRLGTMLQQALQLATANAVAPATAAASSSSAPAVPADPADEPTPMEVDTGLRSRRAESYIPQLPALKYSAMTTRHAEIRIWTSYKEELTSWFCLLDDRYADELCEAESSTVEVKQSALMVGKAARYMKLRFLLRQYMAKFQRAQDLVHLIEITQKGATAGYEFWRLLNKGLSRPWP